MRKKVYSSVVRGVGLGGGVRGGVRGGRLGYSKHTYCFGACEIQFNKGNERR